jgi:hypothetical protein
MPWGRRGRGREGGTGGRTGGWDLKDDYRYVYGSTEAYASFGKQKQAKKGTCTRNVTVTHFCVCSFFVFFLSFVLSFFRSFLLSMFVKKDTITKMKERKKESGFFLALNLNLLFMVCNVFCNSFSKRRRYFQ